MRYLAYNEPIQHRTGDLPLAYYYVDEHHPRYHMRMHWHREVELLWMRSGTLELYVDNEPIRVCEGDFVMLGEGVLHGGDAEGGVYECIVLDPYALLMHIEPCKAVLKPVLGDSLHLEKSKILEDTALGDAIVRLYESVRNGVQGDELKIVGCLYGLFGQLVNCRGAVVRREKTKAGIKTEQLKPALELIEQNYGSQITLEMLARATGLSPKYFCRCFREIMHHSPIDYLNHYRIECASFLLTSSDMTVAEVAQRCGYNDSSFFIKQFRRYKHTTPRHYRSGDSAP